MWLTERPQTLADAFQIDRRWTAAHVPHSFTSSGGKQKRETVNNIVVAVSLHMRSSFGQNIGIGNWCRFFCISRSMFNHAKCRKWLFHKNTSGSKCVDGRIQYSSQFYGFADDDDVRSIASMPCHTKQIHTRHSHTFSFVDGVYGRSSYANAHIFMSDVRHLHCLCSFRLTLFSFGMFFFHFCFWRCCCCCASNDQNDWDRPSQKY